MFAPHLSSFLLSLATQAVYNTGGRLKTQNMSLISDRRRQKKASHFLAATVNLMARMTTFAHRFYRPLLAIANQDTLSSMHWLKCECSLQLSHFKMRILPKGSEICT